MTFGNSIFLKPAFFINKISLPRHLCLLSITVVRSKETHKEKDFEVIRSSTNLKYATSMKNKWKGRDGDVHTGKLVGISPHSLIPLTGADIHIIHNCSLPLPHLRDDSKVGFRAGEEYTPEFLRQPLHK
jgi:hypothetical protein